MKYILTIILYVAKSVIIIANAQNSKLQDNMKIGSEDKGTPYGNILAKIPAELENRTTYTFSNEDSQEEINISFESFPASVADADVIAHNRTISEKFFKGSGVSPVFTGADFKTNVISGHMLTTDLAGKRTIVEAAFRWNTEWIASVRYETSTSNYKAVFDRLLCSIRAVGQKTISEKNYVWHGADKLLIELPDTFTPPLLYRFASEDDDVFLTLFNDEDDKDIKPVFEDMWPLKQDEIYSEYDLDLPDLSTATVVTEQAGWQIDRVNTEQNMKVVGSKYIHVAKIKLHNGKITRTLLIETKNNAFSKSNWKSIMQSIKLAGSNN